MSQSKLRESIRKSFREDSMDDFDRSRYSVLFGDYGCERASTPEEAITLWFKHEKVDRGDVCIIAYTQEQAYDLIQWSHNNIDKIKKLHTKYNNPYKLDYLLDSIESKCNKKPSDFYVGMFGDQIDPFSVG